MKKNFITIENVAQMFAYERYYLRGRNSVERIVPYFGEETVRELFSVPQGEDVAEWCKEHFHSIADLYDRSGRRAYDLNDDYDSLGFAVVTAGGKDNIIDRDGNLLSPVWWDNVCDYQFESHGGAVVLLDGKYNVVMPDGTYKFPEWQDDIYTCQDQDAVDNGDWDAPYYLEVGGVKYLWNEDGTLTLC